MANFIGVVGSDRPESFNQQALALLEDSLHQSDHTVDRLLLADPTLPIYTQITEADVGQPTQVTQFRESIKKADGLLFACPEYNGLMPPALLNGLTWATRSPTAQADLSPFALKPCFIASSSPGSLGGIRAASQLANYLIGLGALVYPQFFLIANAYQVFDPSKPEALQAFQQKAESLSLEFARFCQAGN